MKRLLSLLLVIVVVLGCISGTIFTVNAVTDYTTGETADGIGYSIDNETDELTVTYADFGTTDLVIPAYIEDHPVTAIGDNLLNDTPNPNLKSVVIPDTVNRIGFYAFGNCINLKSVVMSENIENVEDYAFLNTALTNNTDEWKDGALYMGKFLYGVSKDYAGEFVVKDGTRVIGNYCFGGQNRYGCERMTKVSIPDTVVQIGLFAFYNCKGLTSIDIPASVRHIGNCAFGNCSNLATINVDTSKLTYVGEMIVSNTPFYYDESNWQDDVLYLGTAALCGKNTITKLKIKEGTEIVADYAFACNDNIVSVSLPKSLRIICQLAFDDLHSLPSIELPDGLEFIANNAFDGCDQLTELDIPESVDHIGLFAFNRTDKLEKLIIRNPDCTIIDNHEAFAGGAYSINPNTTVYGYEGSTAETFANNNSVSFVPLFEESGKDGTMYGEYTWSFDNVSGVLSIRSTGSSSCETRSYSYGNAPWFSFKDSIKAVVADSKVISVGAYSFTDCTSLETVYMPGVYKVEDYAFDSCEKLKIVELSSEYIQYGKVGKYAFAFCSSLNKIVLPFQSLTINERAFYCCDNLETLGIYTSANIEAEAFSNCPKLSSIYMLNSYIPFQGTVSNNAFSNISADVYCNYCYSKSFSYWEKSRFGGQFTYKSMTEGIVGYDAYWDYDQANEILTISGEGKLFRYSSGNYLPWMDFYNGNNYSIKTIVIEDGITEIPSYSFEYMCNVESVTLPNTLLRLAPNAFRVCESLSEITLPASLEYVDGSKYWYRCENLNDVYYVGTEEEWNEIYDLTNTNIPERITPHFLVYHPATQTCTKAGYPAHYEFDGTAKDAFYDLNKVEITDPVPSKLDHSFSGNWTKDKDSHWHTCSLCRTETADKADHVFDDPCDETCNICGYVRTVEHTVATVEGRPATCTEPGLSDKTYCSACGKVLTEQTVIPALGHLPVIDEAVKATCQHDGLTVGSHCERCGLVYVEQTFIPRLEHTPEEDEAVSPKCTESGLTAGSHCSACGEILTAQEIIPALQHSYEAVVGVRAIHFHDGLSDGIQCTRCGCWLIEQQTIPRLEGAPVLGDADDDGEVNIIDASIIQRASTHIKVPFTEEQLSYADVDGDGSLTTVDATFIQRYSTRVKVPYPVGESL